jgi:hypothetical protein
MPSRNARRSLSTLVASLATTVLLVVETASAAVSEDPLRYRYAGVVTDGRGIPMHYIRRGRGIVFYFSDALSQGRKSESYRVCVGRPGKTADHCWNRTARYGVGKVTFSFTLPSDVRLGPLVARWLIDGRAVATWPFFYVLD